MKNGFTLVELLAVIVILSILIIIAIPTYNSVSDSIKKSNLETTKSMLENAMLVYGNKYLIDVIKPANENCSTARNCCKYYSISYIKNNNIFKTTDNSIKDATTNKELEGYIKLSYNKNKYVLEAEHSNAVPSNCTSGG